MSEQDYNVELASEENIEEASTQKMPVGTEKQSNDSVTKAAGGTKKAPSRKGDSSKQDPMPKGKAGLLNAMYSKLAGMKTDQLMAAYGKMQEDFDLEDIEDEAIDLPEYHFDEELSDLVESEATLSDEFKAKSAVIFETAIRSKLSEEIERLEDEYQDRLSEELEATRSDLVEKVDSYLNYVVDTYMTENKLAIERGIRTEIAEDFMNGLKTLFTESYIDVPESKIDLVDELTDHVEELEEKVNSQTSQVLELSESLEAYQREAVIRENARDLAETQVEKLSSLVESLDFEDVESFSHKVKTVKESYFKKEIKDSQEDLTEDWNGAEEQKEVSSSMDIYLNAIKKSSK